MNHYESMKLALLLIRLADGLGDMATKVAFGTCSSVHQVEVSSGKNP